MKKKFYRPDEIAWQLNCSKRTVFRLIADGYLLAFPIQEKGSIRIPRESFESYVRKQTEKYQLDKGIVPNDAK